VSKTPVARSPIRQVGPIEISHGWEVSTHKSSAELRLADLSQLAKIGVKAQVPPFDIPYGRSVRKSDWIVAGSGPDEWTLIGPIGATFSVETTGFATLTDLTHGRALMRLTGRQATMVLAKLCPIDLSEQMCPNRAAFRASVANVVSDVLRDDIDGISAYLLHCERSSGQFLFDAVLDAGTEFGIDIEGLSWLQAGG
jgi:heterotetrameric sarcosine oxidase gamma subunit